MIRVELLRDHGIFAITPDGPLDNADFELLTAELGRFLASNQKVAGIMIRAKSFPGWRSFRAFLSHLRFVAAHHRHIERIAVVTNSRFLKIIPHVARYVVRPRIKLFGSQEEGSALAWLETGR
jgi:stage II sporulation SpoAA-like protein